MKLDQPPRPKPRWSSFSITIIVRLVAPVSYYYPLLELSLPTARKAVGTTDAGLTAKILETAVCYRHLWVGIHQY